MNETIGARIGVLINALGIRKVRFAEQIKVDQAYVTQLTKGKRNPSDRLISDICREFDVNEEWLRMGEGEMFAEPSEFSLDDLAKQCNASEIDLKIVKKYFELPTNTRRMLVDHFKSVFVEESAGQERTEEQKTPAPVSESGQDELEEVVRKHKANLTTGQQERVLELMQAMIEPQKEPRSPSALQKADERSPKTERPGQS